MTWRLHGTLPNTSPPVVDGKTFVALDRELDRAAAGPDWLRKPEVASSLMRTILAAESDKQLCEVHAFTIMPNHVHLLLVPSGSLPRVLGWIKGYSAREANRILGRTGRAFWQDESFDRWVRDDAEARRITRYILENPVRARLVSSAELWPYTWSRRL